LSGRLRGNGNEKQKKGTGIISMGIISTLYKETPDMILGLVCGE